MIKNLTITLLTLLVLGGCSEQTENYNLDRGSDEYLEFLEKYKENPKAFQENKALEENKVSTYLHCPLEKEYLDDIGIESKFYLVELNTINDKPTESIIHFGVDDVKNDSIASNDSEYSFLYGKTLPGMCEALRSLETRKYEICKSVEGSDVFRKTLTTHSDLRDDIPTYGNKCIYFKKKSKGLNPEYRKESYDKYLGIHRESLKMYLSNQACGIPSVPSINGVYQCKIISKDEYNKIKFDFHRQLDLYIKARQKLELLKKESIKKNKI